MRRFRTFLALFAMLSAIAAPHAASAETVAAHAMGCGMAGHVVAAASGHHADGMKTSPQSDVPPVCQLAVTCAPALAVSVPVTMAVEPVAERISLPIPSSNGPAAPGLAVEPPPPKAA